MNRYEQGFVDGIEAVARAFERANINPPEAKGHMVNGAAIIRYLVARGDLRPAKADRRTRG